jgi:hypothetical protein
VICGVPTDASAVLGIDPLNCVDERNVVAIAVLFT